MLMRVGPFWSGVRWQVRPDPRDVLLGISGGEGVDRGVQQQVRPVTGTGQPPDGVGLPVVKELHLRTDALHGENGDDVLGERPLVAGRAGHRGDTDDEFAQAAEGDVALRSGDGAALLLVQRRVRGGHRLIRCTCVRVLCATNFRTVGHAAAIAAAPTTRVRAPVMLRFFSLSFMRTSPRRSGGPT